MKHIPTRLLTQPRTWRYNS